tara:strand:- start:20531 stop:21064 length:534 start_codon:yes stop_codon:yes gene_type:complete
MRLTKPMFPLMLVVDNDFKDIDNEAIIKEIRTSKPLSNNIHDSRNEDLGLSQYKSCKPLIAKVHGILKEMEKQITLECEEIWAQISTKGMSTPLHTHYNAMDPKREGYSFVYYPQAEKDQGNLVFDLEYSQRRYDMDVAPATGICVIFPLNIKHFTRRNTTDKERIAVAGNFVIKDD